MNSNAQLQKQNINGNVMDMNSKSLCLGTHSRIGSELTSGDCIGNKSPGLIQSIRVLRLNTNREKRVVTQSTIQYTNRSSASSNTDEQYGSYGARQSIGATIGPFNAQTKDLRINWNQKSDGDHECALVPEQQSSIIDRLQHSSSLDIISEDSQEQSRLDIDTPLFLNPQEMERLLRRVQRTHYEVGRQNKIRIPRKGGSKQLMNRFTKRTP